MSLHIFDGLMLDGSWLVSSVDPVWFGAVPDMITDSKGAFDKAIDFCISQGIRKFTISPGSYHLSAPWRVSGNGGNAILYPISVEGYGAILDNTVVVAIQSLSLRGLAVDGAPRHGFVFLRGQGANHQHLLATRCGLDGFYLGIDENFGNYGFNFQVTRSTFSGLVASNNNRHGWHMEGNSTANRSWFNANTVISLGLINNRGKGCLLYTSPSPRDKRQSRMPSSA